MRFRCISRTRVTVAIALVASAAALVATGASAGGGQPRGIEVNRNDGKIGRLLATVRKGKCVVKHGEFHFRSETRKLGLDVDIGDWKGYRHDYTLTVGSQGKVFIDIPGTNNGAYSSEFAIPGSSTGTVAAVRFRRKGSVISVGAPDLPNFDYSRFLAVHGSASCR